MTATPDIQNSTIDPLNNIQFSDLFILEDLQRLQDLFADAHGVASTITDTDGRPITRPSNFCRLCNDIIRKTKKGRANCFKSNAVLGRYDPSGPIVQPCLSGGLWNAGASITVGGKHIANWIISQVRNEEVDEQRIIQYADVIGANREDFRKAFNDVPVMSVEQFNKVAKMLFAFANELSEKAYNNLLLKIQIAERVKATELLQKNEERFQLLFNKAPLGYQSLDFDGNFIEVNQQWLDILGYTREEVIGKWFGDYLSPVFQDGFHDRFPIFKAQGTIHSEFEMVHKNGDKLFVAFEGKIGYDFNGKFKQTHCILQDITGRKQAEESLRESRQILEEIINTMPFRVFWKDKDLTYLGCNTLFARDAGFGKPEDVIGKDDYAMGWREQAELYRADDRLVIGSGRPKLLIEEPQTAPTGEQTCLLTSKVPLKDQTGEIAGVLGTYLDITERKLTEDALRESESQLSETQSVAKVGSWTTDLTNLKVKWSKELYRIFEIDPDSFQSSHQAFLEFVHPEDRAKVDAAFVLSFDSHSVNTIEHQIMTPGGKIKFVEEYWKIISDHQGKPIRAVGSCQDITERKRAEAEQARLLYIMESSLNEIYIFDSVNLIFDYVSQGALVNLGYTREAIQGMTPFDLKPEFTEASFRLYIKPLLRHEQEQLLFNTVHRRADGSLYPVEVHLQLVELEDQRVFLAMILDITERKRAEEEQRKTQRLLSISQRLAHIGSWETEISTGKLSWSDEMYRILGFPAVSPMSLDMALSVFSPDELVHFNKAISSALQGDVPYNIDYTIIRNDGQVRIIHDEGEVIRDEHGQATWMFGTTQDITGRKLAEEALRKSEAIQGKMVANIGDVIVIIDQNGINRYKSANIEKWFGWRPEEVVGESTWENIHPEDLGSTQKIFGALLGEPNATGTTECQYRCKDGSYKWIEFTGVNLLHDPDIRGLLGNYHDITGRKQAELKLQKKNEEIKIQNKELQIAKEHAEESDKLKTAFINNISHEIRTPFNGILGFLSIIQDDDLTSSERDEYISIINKSSYRLMNTINDIVEISQIQAGQMRLTASEINIKRLTGELSDLFKTDAESQGLEFTISNDLPNNIESISTDGVKLKTILSILIGNAIKFTKAGSIEFGIKCRDKAEDRRDKACLVSTPVEIEFSIKDTGIGIPENKQQAIFEQFMQADGSNTRQFEGSGLGLSIAKAYAEMLGGKIWVESDPEGKSGGKGSVFYFTIPYNGEPEEKNVIKNVAFVN